jgi:hypothetical protein
MNVPVGKFVLGGSKTELTKAQPTNFPAKTPKTKKLIVLQIVDAGHFWCKPSSRNKTEAEKYYTLIGNINDYCCKADKQTSNQKSKIPKKGKVYS